MLDLAANIDHKSGSKHTIDWLCEVVYHNGVPVGDVRAGSYGHTLGGPIGLAMVKAPGSGVKFNKQFVEGGKWEVDIAGTRYQCQVSLAPMYDPTNSKIKA
jgi:4-methylaminobutanoate oxidase (formaldehyde-forming)